MLDEEAGKVEVVVPNDQLSLAIGRRGQNVRLASQLTSWAIDILTEDEESERRQKEFADRTNFFIETLDLDETLAQLLVTDGFEKIEELAYLDVAELEAIEGLGEETAQELHARANEHIERSNRQFTESRIALGVSDEVAAFEELTPLLLVRLGESDVKSLDDLADLAGDELVDIVGADQLTLDQANAIIMKAREHWFADGEQPQA